MNLLAQLRAKSAIGKDEQSTTLSWIESVPAGPVELIDTIARRTRRLDDVVIAIVSAALIVLLCFIAVYGSSTVTGVTSDVHDALGQIASGLIAGPVRIIANLVTLGVYMTTLVVLLWNQRWIRLMEAATVAVIGFLATLLFISLLRVEISFHIAQALTVTYQDNTYIGISGSLTTLAGMATVSGQRSDDKAIKWIWNGIWILAVLSVLQGKFTLPGVLISVFLGLTIGNLWRYLAGVTFTEAEGATLVAGIFHAGTLPRRIERVDVTPGLPLLSRHYCARVVKTRPGASSLPLAQTINFELVEREPLKRSEEFSTPHVVVRRGSRNYNVTDTAGNKFHVQVIDPDRQVFSLIRTVWNNIRLRGLHLPPLTTVRASAEKQALAATAAMHAGVHVPAVKGVSRCGESMIILTEVIPHAIPLSDMMITTPKTPELRENEPFKLSDKAVAGLWYSLRRAHTVGLAHHNLDLDAVLIDSDDNSWITSWGYAEIAASELSKRIDLMQLLVLTSAAQDCESALAHARATLGDELVGTLLPLLQNVALPEQIGDLDRKQHLTQQLRELIQPLIQLEPGADIPNYQLRRVTLKQFITSVIGLGALAVIISSVDFSEMQRVVLAANPAWLGIAFLLGLLTYLGSAINLVALTEQKIGLWRSCLVQVAASVVTLIAPAGIGPAAVNLRFLTRKKVPAAVALATVGLVQVTQFVFTVSLLVIVVLLTGKTLAVDLPSLELLFVLGAIVLVAAATLAIPPVRRFARVKIEPLLEQVGPRISWIISKPSRLALAGFGVVVQSASFIAAFGASLAAFGYSLGIAPLTVTFLTANSVGSVIPSPGGLGPVEAALTGGLQVAGIPLTIAVSAAIAYRLVTFWGRVPLGWVALKVLERRNVL